MRTRVFIAAALCFFAAAPALFGQSLPGAGSLSTGGPEDGHAWVCIPARSGPEAVGIVHLPPRGPGVADGSVRLVTQLPQQPEALAARANRLYMAFPRAPGPDGDQRQVLVLTVQPGAIEGSWAIAGEGRRLPALPSLPGSGELLGLAATPVGPAALLSTQGLPRLWILAGSEWGTIPVPPEVPPAEGAVLVGSPDGLAIVDSVTGRCWLGQPRVDHGSVTIAWSVRRFSLTLPSGAPAATPVRTITAYAGGYLYWSRPDRGSGIELWLATEQSAHRLRALTEVAPEFAVAPILPSGRVAVVWNEPGQKTQGQIPPGVAPSESPHARIAEVSLCTGEVLYEGRARVDGPVSSQELKLLAAVLVVVMAVVVIFVLRPGGDGKPISLPRDVVLTEPGRRIAAGLIDVVLAAVVAGRVTDMAFSPLASPAQLLTDSTPMTGLIALALVGFLHGTLGEWLWGRTIGKAVVGCAVAWPGTILYNDRVEPIIRRPTLWRAALRNLIKWVLPPVALSGVFSPERRHRGDLLAATAVVEHAEDESEEGGDEPPVE